MDTIQKFKEAAVFFQKDSKYLELETTRKANDNDLELQKIIGEFNLVRLDLNNEIEKEDKNDEKIAELNAKTTSLYADIMGNEKMIAYTKAKEDIEDFLAHVNAILNAAIDGEDPMLVENPAMQEGCGGGCSSCAGCG